MLVECTYLVNR